MNRTNNKNLCQETILLTKELSERYPDNIRNSVKNTVKYFDMRDIVISKDETKVTTTSITVLNGSILIDQFAINLPEFIHSNIL